jgi:hypothetical protein
LERSQHLGERINANLTTRYGRAIEDEIEPRAAEILKLVQELLTSAH